MRTWSLHAEPKTKDYTTTFVISILGFRILISLHFTFLGHFEPVFLANQSSRRLINSRGRSNQSVNLIVVYSTTEITSFESVKFNSCARKRRKISTLKPVDYRLDSQKGLKFLFS